MKSLKTGIALAVTLTVFYSLCTAFAVLFPHAFIGFVDALFHGLDFGKLITDEPYTWSRFFYAVIIFAVWGFAVGTCFAWIHQTLLKKES